MTNGQTKPGYFGPPALRKEWEQQVAAPLGEPCLHCMEKIVAGDMGMIDLGGRVMHYECQLRGVVGSVAHQEKRCSCYGGADLDLPDGMTVREEAIAAARLWERRNA